MKHSTRLSLHEQLQKIPRQPSSNPLTPRVFVTADQHYGHTGMLQKSTMRQCFRDGEDMDTVLSLNHNLAIRPQDHLFCLGDITLSSNLEYLERTLGRLAGHLYVVEGNHDDWLKKLPKLPEHIRDRIWVLPPLFHFKYMGRNITMCHYPMRTWLPGLMLHGHSHGSLPRWAKTMDVGVDTVEACLQPLSLTKIVRHLDRPTQDGNISCSNNQNQSDHCDPQTF
jgi:calcineurin-like phosphoesterase family protein